MPSTLWIALFIVAVIVIRRFSRLIGSSMGLLVSFVLAGWGYFIYRNGGGIALAGFHLAEGLFYGFVALWAALEVFELSRAIAKRRRPPPRDDADLDADPDESPAETNTPP